MFFNKSLKKQVDELLESSRQVLEENRQLKAENVALKRNLHSLKTSVLQNRQAINTLAKFQKSEENLYKDVQNQVNRCETNIIKNTKRINDISNEFKIAADISSNAYDRSFVVLCQRTSDDKYNYVKIIDFPDNDMQDVVNYIDNFNEGRRVLDVPPVMKNFQPPGWNGTLDDEINRG